MKNIALFLIYAVFAILVSCTSKSDLIAKKWSMKQMEIAGQKLDGDAVSGFSFDIKQDGTYKMTAMEEETGKWKLNGDSLITTRDYDSQSASVIIKELKADKLVLIGSSEGVDMMMEFVLEEK